MRRGAYQMLTILRGQEWATTADLMNGGCGERFGSRLHELRREFACDIEGERVREGSHRYRLLSEPVGLTAKSRKGSGWFELDRILRWGHELAVTGVPNTPGERGIAASRSESQKKATPAPVVPVTAKTVLALPAGVVPVRAHTRRVAPVTGPEQLALEVA